MESNGKFSPGELDFLDVEAQAEEIRQRLNRRFRTETGNASPSPSPSSDFTQLEPAHTPVPLGSVECPDLARLRQETANAGMIRTRVGTINPRPPGLHNRLIQLAKKTMARALDWYTRPLQEFNAAVVLSLAETVRVLEKHKLESASMHSVTNQLQRTLEETLQALSAEAGAHAERLAGAEEKLAIAEQKLAVTEEKLTVTEEKLAGTEEKLAGTEEKLAAAEQELKSELGDKPGQRLRSIERTVRRLSYDNEAHHAAAAPPVSLVPSDHQLESGFDYFMFEEQFRGPERLIKERQSAYLVHFRNCSDVLDLGCGRGEFLELLREHGIPARGVEVGRDAFLLCREKGLDVVQQDLFAYLDSVPDGSVGGIFCSQVIEHLPAELQIRLVLRARQKLCAGGPLLIETINPECFYALSHNFLLDPTHLRPVHPQMLEFLMRSLNFQQVEVKFSSPISKGLPKLRLPVEPSELLEFHAAIDWVNAALFGFQDYAVIGRR